MMSKKKVEEILDRYNKGMASENEKRWVEKWYSALESENNHPVLNDLQNHALGPADWAVIRQRIGRDRRLNIPFRAIAAAAAVAGIMVVAFIYFLKPTIAPPKALTTLEKPKSVRFDNTTLAAKSIRLPDSSQVLLQPNSTLIVAGLFNQSERRVFLEGEAFFTVSHNKAKPFYVETGSVTTHVLGTVFNVKAIGKNQPVTVAVKSGKVSVYAHDEAHPQTQKNTVLTANQKAVYDPHNGGLQKILVEAPQVVIQETEFKKMKFELAPMQEVMAALETAYGIDIEFDEEIFSGCKITTSIAGGGIYNRLDLICKAIGASYTVVEGEIVITGKGCE